MTAEEIIKKRYPFYDPNIAQKDIEINGEDAISLMHEFASQKDALINSGVNDIDGTPIKLGDKVKLYPSKSKLKMELNHKFWGKQNVKFKDGSFYLQKGGKARRVILSGKLVQAFGIKVLQK